MTLADDVLAAAQLTGTDAQEAAQRALDRINATAGERDQARQDLADYIAAHPDDSGTLQGVLDSLTSTDAALASIAPADVPPTT